MLPPIEPADYDVESLSPGEAVAVDWSAERYRDDTVAETRSSLRLLENDPPAYRASRNGKRQDTSSPSKRFGTIMHMAVLEPAEFTRRVRPKPAGASDDAIRFGLVESPLGPPPSDSIWIDAADYQRIVAMYNSIAAHRTAKTLLSSPGRAELTVVWRHPTTGILVKVRPDWLTRLEDLDERSRQEGLVEGWAVPDLKTSKDPTPRPFLRAARYDLGYIEQAAMYEDALEAWLGETARWYFIAVGNKPRKTQLTGLSPHAVGCYPLTDREIQWGRDRYTRRLEDLLERSITDDWRHDWERGAHMIGAR